MTSQPAPRRILIVDDAPSVRQALRWLLNDTPGFEVVGEAADGEAAVSSGLHLHPDIVILDVELPRLTGYEVAQSLKKMAAPPIIIFLTGHGDSVNRQRALDVGGDSFVEKSEGWPALLAQIRALMKPT